MEIWAGMLVGQLRRKLLKMTKRNRKAGVGMGRGG